MIMENQGKHSDQDEHRANEKLVVSFNPVKLELAGTVKWKGHKRCHDGNGAAHPEKEIVNDISNPKKPEIRDKTIRKS